MYLRYRAQGQQLYHVWNLNEKVTLIEDHQKDYTVIGLREISDSGVEEKYCHSIVKSRERLPCKVQFGQSDGISARLGDGINEWAIWEIGGMSNWRNDSTKSNATKLQMIFQSLDRYALANVLAQPTIGCVPAQDQRRKPIGSAPPAPS